MTRLRRNLPSPSSNFSYLEATRHYRQRCRPQAGETTFQIVVEQTDIWVVAETDLAWSIQEYVLRLRGVLKAYITIYPEFAASLAPVSVSENAHPLIRQMAAAAAICRVGPMAAVAGAIAEYVAMTFANDSPNILVENGGDCYLYSTKPRVVGLLTDPAGVVTLGLALAPQGFPLSLCASSATIGPSLSLGHGKLVVVRAKNGALADATATALGNLLRDRNDIKAVLARAEELAPAGVDGLFLQLGGIMAVWGQLELTTLS
ncbi:conserved hypothetical protein [Desulfovibrionales bacterium]